MTNAMVNQTTVMTQGFQPGRVITMSSREIAGLTNKRHDHVKRDIEKMLSELGEDIPSFGGIYFDSMNREQTEYHLDRELTDTLLTGYSARLRRKVIARWHELEPGTVTGPPQGKIVAELAIAECFTRMLRPSPSSQMAMLQHIAKSNGVDGSFLPGYAIDAAPDATGGGSMPTAPITLLLQQNGIRYTARSYNQLLRDAGILEERTRASKTGPKQFWSITEKGQRYGKNLTNPQSPRETQPHWYTERFVELHGLVTSRLAGKDAD